MLKSLPTDGYSVANNVVLPALNTDGTAIDMLLSVLAGTEAVVGIGPWAIHCPLAYLNTSNPLTTVRDIKPPAV